MKLSLSSGVRWLEVDDGLVVFSPLSQRFVDLNDSASFVWKLLIQADWSAEPAVARLREMHELTAEDATEIVETVLNSLLRSGVVTQYPAPFPSERND